MASLPLPSVLGGVPDITKQAERKGGRIFKYDLPPNTVRLQQSGLSYSLKWHLINQNPNGAADGQEKEKQEEKQEKH